nr:hypothetical protein [uncultured Neisseria sp.]
MATEKEVLEVLEVLKQEKQKLETRYQLLVVIFIILMIVAVGLMIYEIDRFYIYYTILLCITDFVILRSTFTRLKRLAAVTIIIKAKDKISREEIIQ